MKLSSLLYEQTFLKYLFVASKYLGIDPETDFLSLSLTKSPLLLHHSN